MGRATPALTELREEAYARVLRCFATQLYDLSKDLMLTKLRSELHISDDCHDELRRYITEHPNDPEPWRRGKPRKQGAGSKRPAEHPLAYDRFLRASPGSALEPPVSPFKPHAQGHNHWHDNDANPWAGGPAARQAKRARQEGGSAAEPTTGMSALRNGYAGNETHAGAPRPAEIDGLIGYKVRRNWPENGGWFEGAISDYNANTGEHCIVYDMNTSSETFEWFNVRAASRGDCQVMDERINVLAHAPRSGPANGFDPSKKPGRKSVGDGLSGRGGRGMINGRGTRGGTNAGRGLGSHRMPPPQQPYSNGYATGPQYYATAAHNVPYRQPGNVNKPRRVASIESEYVSEDEVSDISED